MNITPFINTFETGINNPDCSFFVGTTYGQIISMKSVMIMLGLYIILKAIDKLAIEPVFSTLGAKIKRLLNKNEKA